MRRTLQKELEDPLAHMILEASYPYGTTFIADSRNKKIFIHLKHLDRAAGEVEAERVHSIPAP
jgi:ATP-dependent Clp protease ATP-binding subunit ClpA